MEMRREDPVITACRRGMYFCVSHLRGALVDDGGGKREGKLMAIDAGLAVSARFLAIILVTLPSARRIDFPIPRSGIQARLSR